jgi:hypothetical protein
MAAVKPIPTKGTALDIDFIDCMYINPPYTPAVIATAFPILLPSKSSKYISTAKLPAAVAIAPPIYPVCLAAYIFPFISNLFTLS